MLELASLADSMTNPEKLFESLLQGRDHSRLPPVQNWHPVLNGDLDMRIDKNGVWHYQGGAIRRRSMVKMFSTILKREGDEYFLVTPVEKWRINVEDVPFIICQVRVVPESQTCKKIQTEKSGQGGDVKKQALVFATTVDSELVLGPDNPLWLVEDAESGEPRPYIKVRNNLHGLLQRHVFYHLVEMAVPETVQGCNKLGVWSLGHFYSLGNNPEI
ncbi:MAG: DUF1285 domain-containing protein [Exilibacterium sp.]